MRWFLLSLLLALPLSAEQLSLPNTEVRGIVEHMSDRDRLQRLILIGIAYGGPRDPQSRGPIYRRNRTRDYTPVFSPDGGYGPEFRSTREAGRSSLRFFATS